MARCRLPRRMGGFQGSWGRRDGGSALSRRRCAVVPSRSRWRRPIASPIWAVGRWLDRWVGECCAKSPQSTSLGGTGWSGPPCRPRRNRRRLARPSRRRGRCMMGIGATLAGERALSLSTVGGVSPTSSAFVAAERQSVRNRCWFSAKRTSGNVAASSHGAAAPLLDGLVRSPRRCRSGGVEWRPRSLAGRLMLEGRRALSSLQERHHGR